MYLMELDPIGINVVSSIITVGSFKIWLWFSWLELSTPGKLSHAPIQTSVRQGYADPGSTGTHDKQIYKYALR